MRIVVVSPRVAPGILTLAAWDALVGVDLDFVMRRSDGTALLFNRYARISRVPQLGPITEGLAAAGRPGVIGTPASPGVARRPPPRTHPPAPWWAASRARGASIRS